MVESAQVYIDLAIEEVRQTPKTSPLLRGHIFGLVELARELGTELAPEERAELENITGPLPL